MAGYDEDKFVTEYGAPTRYESDYYEDERGFVSDTGVAFARGLTRVTEMIGEAGERVGISNPLDEYSSKIRDEYLKPDESEYYGEQSWLKRGFTGAIESLPTSMAVIGSFMVNPVIGVAALGTIGAGVDQMAQDDYLKANPGDYEGAKSYGLKHGLSEVGSEALSDLLPFAGKLFKFGGKQGVKSLSDMVGSMSAKEIGSMVAASYATEGSTELANAAYQASLANEAGVSEMSPLEAMAEAAGPVLFMGAGFSAATVGMTAAERSKVRRGLNVSTAKPVRSAMATSVAKGLESRVGKEESAKWLEVANYNIENDLDIPISSTFDKVYEDMESHKQSIDPLTKDTEELDQSVSANLEKEEPIARVNVGAVADNAANRIYEATDEELRRMEGTKFQDYVPRGLLSKEEATGLDELLKTRLLDLTPEPVVTEEPVVAEEPKESFDIESRVAEILEEGKVAEQARIDVTPQAIANKEGANIALSEAQKINEAITDKRFKADMANTITLGMANVNQSTNELDVVEDANEIQRIQRAPTKVLKEVIKKTKKAKVAKEKEVAKTTKLNKKQELRKDIQSIDQIQKRAQDVLDKQVAEVVLDTKVTKVEKADKIESLEIEKAKVDKKARDAKQAEVTELRDAKKAEEVSKKKVAEDIRAAVEAKDVKLATKLTKSAILGSDVGKTLTAEEVDILVETKLAKDGLSIKEEEKEAVVLEVGDIGSGISVGQRSLKEKSTIDTELVEWEGDLKSSDFIVGKGVDGSSWFITRGDDGSLEITSPSAKEPVVLQKSKNMFTKAKQLVNSQVALSEEGISALADVKTAKVARTKERKAKATEVTEGFKGISRTGTIDGTKYTLTRVPKGPGKGWYLKGDEGSPKLKLGDTKTDAVLYLEEKGTKTEPKGEAPVKVFTKEEIAKVAEEREVEPDAGTVLARDPRTGITKVSAREKVEELYGRVTRREDLFVLKHILENLDPKLIDELDMFYDDTIKYRGQYTSSDHQLRLRSDSNDKTLLHEVIHAVTVRQVYLDPKYRAKATELYDEFLGKRDKTKKTVYGMANVNEFLAEALSNPRFQEELKNIPSSKDSNVSLFDKFKEWIVSLFKGKGINRSLLQDAIDVVITDNEGMIPIRPSDEMAIQRAVYQRGPNIKQGVVIEPEVVGDTSDYLTQLNESHEPVITTGPREFLSSTTHMLKKLAMPLTERLRGINPELIKYLRRMELNISRENVKAAKTIKPFADFYSNLDEDKRTLLNWALKNNDEEAIKIRGDILGDSFKGVEDLLGDIHDRMESVGLNNFSPVDQYFPRKVKDIEGLMRFMRSRKDIQAIEEAAGRPLSEEERAVITKEAESLTVIEESLLSAQERKGSALTPAEKAEVVNGIMNTGRYNAISFNIPSSAKARGIRRVSPAMDKFYEDSMDSLIAHVYSTNEAIETRKIFNFNNRKQLVSRGNKAAKLYKKKLSEGEDVAGELTELEQISEELRTLDSDTTEGISQFLAEQGLHLNTDQQKEAVEIFKSRLDQRGTYGAFSTIRNAMLISTLGNPASAVTQLGDLVWSIYDNGFKNTASSIFGAKRMSKKDFDFESAMGEFTGGSSRYVDFALKWSGLKAMDLFGKDVYLESALKKAEGMSEQEFIDNQEHVFGDKAAEVYRKIVEGNWRDSEGTPDPDVQYYAFNALSNTQPISLSEMPQTYLTSGQGRILYTLKTYALKQINNVIRESRKPGLANKVKAAKLVTLLTLAGASADELKDLMLGRTTEFSDHIYDNLFKISLLSRYSLESARSGKGILTDLLVPPTGIIDYAKEDMVSLFTGDPSFQSIKNMPWGRQLEAWMPSGREKSYSNERKAINEDFRKVLAKKGDLSSIRARINSYNKRVRGTDAEPINYIKSRKYHIRKVREERS